jgi:four helix bundle protein
MPTSARRSTQNRRRFCDVWVIHSYFCVADGGREDCLIGRVTKDELIKRTKVFAVAVVKLVRTLPTDVATTVMSRQLVKSGTAIGANYRGSCRAKSRPDFISKMTTVEEEADETLFWLEMLVETNTVRKDAVAWLLDESEQLLRIVVASIKTARGFGR